MAEKYRLHFSNLSYQNISIFTDQNQAISALEQSPAVFFLNYDMVVESGFEILKRIKLFNPNIFIVTLCNRDDFSFALNSLKYGAFDCIKKGENDLSKITDVLNRIEIFKSRIAPEPITLAKRISSLFFKNF